MSGVLVIVRDSVMAEALQKVLMSGAVAAHYGHPLTASTSSSMLVLSPPVSPEEISWLSLVADTRISPPERLK